MSEKSTFGKEKAIFSKEKSMFGKDKNPSNILPEKFTLESKIQFRCHPGVSCFTECCGNIKIVLTPYDILQIRKRLEMDAAEFLREFFSIPEISEIEFKPNEIIE